MRLRDVGEWMLHLCRCIVHCFCGVVILADVRRTSPPQIRYPKGQFTLENSREVFGNDIFDGLGRDGNPK